MWRKLIDKIFRTFNKIYYNPFYLSRTRSEFWDQEKYKAFLLKNIEWKENMKILDVGCGIGFLTFLLADIAPCKVSLVGLDISTANINFAKRTNRNKNVEFVKCDGYKTTFPDQEFNLVICQSVLINTHSPKKLIREMIRLTKNKGGIIAIEPLAIDLSYYPQFRITNTTSKIVRKIIQFAANILRVDKQIVLKLPQMFIDNGLTNLQTDIYAVSNFMPEKVNVEDYIKFANEQLEKLSSFNLLQKMLWYLPIRLCEEQKKWYEKVIKDPSVLRKTGEIKINPLLLVKGRKE